MAATIKIKNSSTASAVPTSSDLVQGELAVNVTDKRIFTENASGTVVELGTNPTILTLPDGSASAPTLTNDGDTNTGIFFPAADTVGISTGGTERARVDSAGNLGLGVTPSAWGSGFKAMDVNTYGAVSSSTTAFRLFANSYGDGTNWIYKTTAAASRYDQTGGSHAWQIAASGTAGNAITFTQAMTLDASGNLGIGTTSPSVKLQVAGVISSNDTVRVSDGTTTTVMSVAGSSEGVVGTSSNHSLQFRTNNTERARIDSSGNLLVGTTSTLGPAVVNIAYDGSTKWGISLQPTGTSSASAIVFRNTSSTICGSISVATSATTYNTSSDYRLKDVTGPVTGAEAKDFIMALQPKQGTWKVDGSKFVGFLAHEFQEISPTSVTGEKDAVDEDGNPKYQAMQASSSEVIANLVAHIQNLETRLAALEQA